MIHHIWFDFSGTLVDLDEKVHNQLRYGIYAKVLNRSLDQKLIEQYEEAFLKQGSNAGVFRSLGLESDFWGKIMESQDSGNIFFLLNANTNEILKQIKKLVSVSLFTNIKPRKILQALEMPGNLFTNILQAGDYKEPKPALDGFKKMIELSNLNPEEILYVGDSVVKDILPAKSLGIKTCLIFGKSAEADFCVLKLEDILAILKR